MSSIQTSCIHYRQTRSKSLAVSKTTLEWNVKFWLVHFDQVTHKGFSEWLQLPLLLLLWRQTSKLYSYRFHEERRTDFLVYSRLLGMRWLLPSRCYALHWPVFHLISSRRALTVTHCYLSVWRFIRTVLKWNWRRYTRRIITIGILT